MPETDKEDNASPPQEQPVEVAPTSKVLPEELQPKKERTLSRKVTIIEQPKKPLLSYMFAALACFSFGTGNYLNSILSVRLPPFQGVFAQSIGYLLVWIFYYIFRYLDFRCRSKNKGQDFYTKKSSMYYEEFEVEGEEVDAEEQKDDDSMDSFDRDMAQQDKKDGKVAKKVPKTIIMFSGLRLSVPLIRALAQGAITILIIFTFYFAFPSGVNAGIISSIFASSCIFTILIFFFKYGQKVTKFDALGAFLIVLCVALVGVGGAMGQGDSKEKSDKTEEELAKIYSEQTFNLVMAMVFATLTGLAFSLQAMTIKFSLDVGADPNQSYYDCSFVIGSCFLPFLIYDLTKDPIPYNGLDILIATIIVFLICLGVVFLGKGLQYGKAGSVQAIENAKTIVQTILAVIFLGQIPNVVQICGLVTGLIGVFVIILQKKGDDQEKPDEKKEQPKE